LEERVPTYQYVCTACGERLEAVQKFTDDPLSECPSCKGKLRKVFSAVGIVFKGSGFYRTDSRASSSSTDSSSSGSSSNGSASSKEPASSSSSSAA
jgi:putative FmdB family regulatory protein